MAEVSRIDETVSERFAGFLAGLTLADVPPPVLATALRDLTDAAGLCLAARNGDYIAQVLEACDTDGPCTVIGHTWTLDAAGAA
ncbi:MAG TPA: hypothetical protein VLA52_09555, partial [Thermohalobaculum sp.]|nr:hypothetical protein [Thermohalobaculum sp.]